MKMAKRTPSSVPAARRDWVMMSLHETRWIDGSVQKCSIGYTSWSVCLHFVSTSPLISHSELMRLWQVSPAGPITWGRLGKTGTPSSTATRTFPMWMPLAKYSKAPEVVFGGWVGYVEYVDMLNIWICCWICMNLYEYCWMRCSSKSLGCGLSDSPCRRFSSVALGGLAAQPKPGTKTSPRHTLLLESNLSLGSPRSPRFWICLTKIHSIFMWFDHFYNYHVISIIFHHIPSYSMDRLIMIFGMFFRKFGADICWRVLTFSRVKMPRFLSRHLF